MANELTLTELLEQSNQAKILLDESIKLFNQGILEINTMVKDIDDLIFQVKLKDEKYELMRYKSIVLKMKADHQKQVEELNKRKKELIKVITIVEKIIQLNTGDIF